MCTTIEVANTAPFQRRKSHVRSYCLSVDPIFDIARGSTRETSTEGSTSTSFWRGFAG
jgi:hypothetical protein